MKKINLDSIRLKILNASKKHLIIYGWNDKIFQFLVKKDRFKEEELRALFPNGYKSLLELYLSNADKEMEKACKKIDLIRMRVHERIRAIILMRFKINEKDKKLVKRTFFSLMLPQHNRIATKSLYSTVNKIWYLAGDNATDFNYYTKRGILAAIYISTVFYWVKKNNRTFEETKKFLDKQLRNSNKIHKIKEKYKLFFDSSPKIFSLIKKLSFFKR